MPGRTLLRPLSLLLLGAIILAACAPAVTAGADPTQPAAVTGDITAPDPTAETQAVEEQPQAETASQTAKEENNEAAAAQDAPVEVLVDREPVISATPVPKPPLGEDDWQDFPIIPTISDRARQIYRDGVAAGNDPERFSKIGDCQNITTYFLALYDDPEVYTLGPDYEYLEPVITYYQGSWSRESIAVKGGFNVASVFNPWFNNKELCGENESPVACELRVYQPSVVLISMETWWNSDTSKYEGYLRQIVDAVIAHGAVPVLATKADNVEGDHSINKAIARVAYEYDLPLWNFWRSVQPLPRHGVEKDGFHITHGLNDFSDPLNLRAAWPMRNLTALQVMDAVWRGLQEE